MPGSPPPRCGSSRAGRIAAAAGTPSCGEISFALQELPVELLDPLGFDVVGKIAFDHAPTGPSQGLGAFGPPYERQNACRQPRWIAGWHQQTGLAVDDQFT